MGSAGDAYDLIPLPGCEQAAEARVKEVILDTLAEVWNDFLPYAHREMASQWILLGLDSLLTIEVGPGQVIFWFYESVAWPEGIANHWLNLALAARRRDFEIALARVGYGVSPSDWPDLTKVVEGSTRGFVSIGTDVGDADAGRREVSWQWRGGDYEVPSTSFDDLEPSARERVEAALTSGRCACPVCEARFGAAKVGPFEAGPGFEARREAIFSAKEISAIARPAGQRGWLVAASSRAHASWTLCAPSFNGPWSTIAESSDPRRSVDYVASMGDVVVAQMGTASKGDRLIALSRDGGATWEKPVPTPGLPSLKRARFFDGGAPGAVIGAGYPSNDIYVSSDGGASFEVMAKALSLAGDPIRFIRSLAAAPGKLFAIVETKNKKSGIRLGVSDDRATREDGVATNVDRGATFRDVEVPGLGEPSIVVSGSWENKPLLICAGAGGIARSVDGGETWTLSSIDGGSPHDAAISSARGSVLVATGSGVYVSMDGGATFALGARCVSAKVFADPTGASLGLFAVEGVVSSLHPASS